MVAYRRKPEDFESELSPATFRPAGISREDVGNRSIGSTGRNKSSAASLIPRFKNFYETHICGVSHIPPPIQR
jgi:hypothetical protein